MLINGEVNVTPSVELDLLKKLISEYSRVGNNINQIAKIANSSRRVFKVELEEIQEEQQSITKLLRKILQNQQRLRRKETQRNNRAKLFFV